MKHLPLPILSMIATYLSAEDLMNFRLTCRGFYEATICKAILSKFKVQPRASNGIFYKFMENINGGKFITLNLVPVRIELLVKVLTAAPNITNLSIKIQHLNTLSNLSCTHLRTLILVDKDMNYFSKMDSSKYIEHFQNLSSFELKELEIKGCGQVYSSCLIKAILDSTKSINKLSLDSLIINNSKDVAGFKDYIWSCCHIKSWVWQNIHVTNKKRLLLPESITHYKCINSALSLIDKQHSKLQQFALVGMIPYVDKIWKENEFNNLKDLELNGCFFYHSSMDKCLKLKSLKILKCHLPFSYLANLSSVVQSNLTYLCIEAFRDFDNEKILKIIKQFTKLVELTLINMNEITPMFLYALKHNHLRFMFLRNCQNFRSAKCRDEVNSMKNYFSFSVQLQNCNFCHLNAFR